jgi:O-antigen ligase
MDVTNPVRRILFYFALGAIFIRFSVIHEALAVLLNLNLYLLYLVMPPAILGVIITGGLRRTLKAPTARYYIAFVVWLFIAVPFSGWRGGSAADVFAYAKTEVAMIFIVAGLVMTWGECKLVMYTLAVAGATDLLIGRVFMQQGSDRSNLAMGGSTIANSNDLAVHLILMMGFLLYFVLAPKVPKLISYVCLPAIGYGVYIILSAGSRGGLVALSVCVLFTFVMGSSKYRMALIILGPIAAVAIVSQLPRSTLLRLGTLTSTSADAQVQDDAEGSADARRELLKKSLVFTVQHPLFGVGPGQFYSAEGGESVKEGRRGMWHATHNSWTQISSECGIPAATFFICAMVSALRLLWKTNKQARANPVNADIASATFCAMLGMIGFMAAITFANFAYFFYEPALCGLCIAIYYGAQHEMAARQFRAAAAPPAAPLWNPAQPLALSPPSFASKLR